ncbi:MAG: DUF4373 domain-containing protein [Muribaculaceae bacterium]|nr:DUF4373 domain-containing protein [Muribaculaceae bacterium]
MARPLKRGLDYFPLNVDFFDSNEIYCLGAEMGPKAEYAALRLLAEIYRNGYYLEWSAKSRLMIARKIELTGEFLDGVIHRLIEMDFFDGGLFDSDSILTSRSIQEVYFEAVKRRNRRPETYPYLLIMHSETKVNSCNIPQMKEKETKAKENETIPTSTNKVEEDELERMLECAAADTEWVAEMAAYLNEGGGVEAIVRLLKTDFRSHCIREGKHHSGINDLKSHFNRWSKKQSNNNKQQLLNSINYGTNHPRRRSSSYESKLPVNPACGLKRRPD